MSRHYDEILSEFRRHPDATIQHCDRLALRPFLAGYLEAIAFTEQGDIGDELNGLDLTIEGEGGWGDGEIAAMLADAWSFMADARKVIAQYLGLCDLWADGEGYSTERLAHDFWLTRNGHGTGFWDRRFTYGEDGDKVTGLGDALSALVGHDTAYGPLNAVRGDDGRAYLEA